MSTAPCRLQMSFRPRLPGPRAVVALLLTVPAVAGRSVGQAPPADTVRLSFSDVLTRVRAEHPVSRLATSLVGAAEARAAELRRFPNPSVEVERTTLTETDNLALLQPIRWPWESRALRDVGLTGVAIARAEAALETRAVTLQAAERFADALRSTRALALAVEAESLAQRALDRVIAARELGQAGDLVVLQAQVSLDAARRERLTAESEKETVIGGLALLLGYSREAEITLEQELETVAPLSSLDSSLERMTAGDPELLGLRGEADRAAAEARLARARRWPELDLGPAAALGPSRAFGLSVVFTLPLWNRQGSAIRAAEADRNVAAARLEARHRELAAVVLNASTTLPRVGRELGLLRSGELARAAQAESLAARAAQQGGPYLTAWLAARQAYLDARRAELDLEWEAARARIRLRHLAGTLVMEETR